LHIGHHRKLDTAPLVRDDTFPLGQFGNECAKAKQLQAGKA